MPIIAENKSIGIDTRIAESAHIECKSLEIGKNVVIDERTKIICKGGKVVIGDQTYIGNDVTIILSNFEIGEYCKLHNHSLLNGKGSVYIGHNGWFGQNCILNGEADLHIGNNVGIGTYSSVWTHGYFGQLVDGCTLFSIKPTVIEDDVWLVGSYNTIFPGVTIGKGAVLMGTSVVTKSLESKKVYGGNPAKDLTDKIGWPYEEISFEKKVEIIKECLSNHFEQAKISFQKESETTWNIPSQGGKIHFGLEAVNLPGDAHHIIFAGDVKDWSGLEHVSQFCLTTKMYSKCYAPLEVLVRKILNPTVARFVPKTE